MLASFVFSILFVFVITTSIMTISFETGFYLKGTSCDKQFGSDNTRICSLSRKLGGIINQYCPAKNAVFTNLKIFNVGL